MDNSDFDLMVQLCLEANVGLTQETASIVSPLLFWLSHIIMQGCGSDPNAAKSAVYCENATTNRERWMYFRTFR